MEEVNKNIATIFQQNIPSGKKALQDSHKNLAEIADYCERQYVSVNNTYKGNDKTKALEETRTVFAETKQYATQSLASVAYQIHALAASVLDLLDNQASQLNQMNSDISYISNVSEFLILYEFHIKCHCDLSNDLLQYTPKYVTSIQCPVIMCIASDLPTSKC